MKSFRIKHTSTNFNQSPIFPFSYPVLLRCIRNNLLMLNSMLRQICIKLIFNEFPPIISSQRLNFLIRFILNHDFKLLKFTKSFTFIFQKIYPRFTSKIINKCKKINCMRQRSFKRTTNVTMD